MNLFGTALTDQVPRERVRLGQLDYPVVSPEAIRTALRETLRLSGLLANVRDADYADPERWADDPDRWADDYFFGYFVANRGDFPFTRHTLTRVNLAMALEPNSWHTAQTHALLHADVTRRRFHYPFALNLDDLRLDDPAPPGDSVVRPDGGTYRTRGEQHQDWLRYLLRGLSELNCVSGNHVRRYYAMAPASIVLRFTAALIAGYDLYAFQPDGSLPEVVDAVLQHDFPGSEFVLGGDVVRDVLAPDVRVQLRRRGVALYRRSAQALDAVARRATGAGFLPAPGEEMA